MSMVTPPVALAAYASASIAQAGIMPTAFAAFRFSLVGFTLPFMFVYRPALLLMDKQKWGEWMDALKAGQDAAPLLRAATNALPPLADLVLAVGAASVGIVSLAAGIAGYFRAPLSMWSRCLLMVAAALLLSPDISVAGQEIGWIANVAGGVLFALMAAVNWKTQSVATSG